MRIYIVDDDKNVIKILERIIIDKNLGDIVGSAQDGITALEEIKSLRPDIALVDLLMPGMDGISLVKEIKSITMSPKGQNGISLIIVVIAYNDEEIEIRSEVK